MTVKALLLAGGLGTRLRPLTDEMPKCLVPIGDRALIDYWFDAFRAAGISAVRMNNHHLPELVRAHLEAINARGGLRVEEAYEPVLLGSAGTVTANADLAEDGSDVLVVYADNLSDVDLRSFIEFHESHDDPFTMLLFHTEFPERCGIATLDEEGRIVDFVEKPEQPTSDLANAGVYMIDAAVYGEIAAMGAFDLGYDVIPRLAGRMRGWVWGGYHRDIGTLDSLEQARRDVGEIFVAARGGGA